MANLEDSFLADSEDLSDNDNENLDEDSDDAEHMEEDVNGDLVDVDSLNYDDLDSVSKLHKSQRYSDIVKKVMDALEKGLDMSNQGIALEDDPEYQLFMECNTLSVDIENEIVIIHNFIRDKYRLKFPELESLVHHPIDYARVVKKIGNEVDLTIVDLEGLLPSAIIMAISVAASTTSGKPLPEDVLQKTIEACDRALTLDASKKKVLDFVESRMGYIAPNLSAIVGSAVAAKLIGAAGGLLSLAKMPGRYVQRLGAKKGVPFLSVHHQGAKKAIAGVSTASSVICVGHIKHTELCRTTHPAHKMRACRLLAAKSALAARLDCFRGDPSGSKGRKYRDAISNKIEEWQKPPPAKLPKRLRKMRARLGIPEKSSLGKFKDRLRQIGIPIPEESSSRDGLEGSGMPGQAGSLMLRVCQSKLDVKGYKELKDEQYSSGGATSALTSGSGD